MSLYFGEQKIPSVLINYGEPLFESAFQSNSTYNSTCSVTASITLTEKPKFFKFYAKKMGYSQTSSSTTSTWTSILFGGLNNLNSSTLIPVIPTITGDGKTFSCTYSYTPPANKYAFVGVFILIIYIP